MKSVSNKEKKSRGFFQTKDAWGQVPLPWPASFSALCFFADSQARPSTASVLLVAEGAVAEGGFIQDDAVVVIGVEAGGASEVRL